MNDDVADKLAAWSDCVLEFAQVRGASKETAVTIALSALSACLAEKSQYRRALRANYENNTGVAPIASDKVTEQLSVTQKSIVLRAILLVRDMRMLKP